MTKISIAQTAIENNYVVDNLTGFTFQDLKSELQQSNPNLTNDQINTVATLSVTTVENLFRSSGELIGLSDSINKNIGFGISIPGHIMDVSITYNENYQQTGGDAYQATVNTGGQILASSTAEASTIAALRIIGQGLMSVPIPQAMLVTKPIGAVLKYGAPFIAAATHSALDTGEKLFDYIQDEFFTNPQSPLSLVATNGFLEIENNTSPTPSNHRVDISKRLNDLVEEGGFSIQDFKANNSTFADKFLTDSNGDEVLFYKQTDELDISFFTIDGDLTVKFDEYNGQSYSNSDMRLEYHNFGSSDSKEQIQIAIGEGAKNFYAIRITDANGDVREYLATSKDAGNILKEYFGDSKDEDLLKSVPNDDDSPVFLDKDAQDSVDGETYFLTDIVNSVTSAGEALGEFIGGVGQNLYNNLSTGDGLDTSFVQFVNAYQYEIGAGNLEFEDALEAFAKLYANNVLQKSITQQLSVPESQALISEVLIDGFNVSPDSAEKLTGAISTTLSQVLSTFATQSSGWDSEDYAKAASASIASSVVNYVVSDYLNTNSSFGNGVANISTQIITSLINSGEITNEQWEDIGLQVGVQAIGQYIGLGPVNINTFDGNALEIAVNMVINAISAATGPFAPLTQIVLRVLQGSLYGGKKFYEGEFGDKGALLNTIYQVQDIEVDDGNGGTTTVPALVAVTLEGSTIIMQEGITHLIGGVGDDILVGAETDDVISGGYGTDYLEGKEGAETMFGGAGNDYIIGAEGDDIIQGDDGDDVIFGDAGADTILGGDGDDFIHAGGNEEASVDTGEVDENGDPIFTTLMDTVSGGAGNDTILGAAGQDLLQGNEGDDIIDGGYGDDLLDGGEGNDILFGNLGNDSISGEDGNDIIFGSEGNDRASGGKGDDYVNGGIGNDILEGGNGDDLIYGDADDDFLQGDLGNDRLLGGAGADTILGGLDDDYLFGQEGDDILRGGLGSDVLDGGAGNNQLSDEGGDDIYVLDINNAGSGVGQITDSEGNDKIYIKNLDSGNLTNFELNKSGDNLQIIYNATLLAEVIGHFEATENSIERIELNSNQFIDLPTVTLNNDDTISYSVYFDNDQNADSIISQFETQSLSQIQQQSNFINNGFIANLSEQAYEEKLRDDIEKEYYNGSEILEFKRERGSFGGHYKVYKLNQSDQLNGTDETNEYIDFKTYNLADYDEVMDDVTQIVMHYYRPNANGINKIIDLWDAEGNHLKTHVLAFSDQNGAVYFNSEVNQNFSVDVYVDGVYSVANAAQRKDNASYESLREVTTVSVGEKTISGNPVYEVIEGINEEELINANPDEYHVEKIETHFYYAPNNIWVTITDYWDSEGNHIKSYLYETVNGGVINQAALPDEFAARIYDNNGDYLGRFDAAERKVSSELSELKTITISDEVSSDQDYHNVALNIYDESEFDYIDNSAEKVTLFYYNHTWSTWMKTTDLWDSEGNHLSGHLYEYRSVSGEVTFNSFEDENFTAMVHYSGTGHPFIYADAYTRKTNSNFDSFRTIETVSVGVEESNGVKSAIVLGDAINIVDYENNPEDYNITKVTVSYEWVNFRHVNVDITDYWDSEGNHLKSYIYDVDAATGNPTQYSYEISKDWRPQVRTADGNIYSVNAEERRTSSAIESIRKIEISNESLLDTAKFGINTGSDHLVGSYWDEDIKSYSGDDALFGGNGDDIVNGSQGEDWLFGGDGNDYIEGGYDSDSLFGGAGDDIIRGQEGDDSILAGAGNDAIYGNSGSDWLDGGAGDDEIKGGAGNDIIYSGAGNDYSYGSSGDDVIYGNEGDDRLYGDAGNDTLNGGEGIDRVYGGTGADTLFGGGENDYLYGNEGDDTINGGDGRDYIRGDEGDDIQNGEEGHDILYGSTGSDILNGGEGYDYVYYYQSESAVTVNLFTGEASGGHAEGDTLISIERVHGSNYDDFLTGDNGANYIVSRWGADTVDLMGGNDHAFSFADGGTFDGGSGTDRINYTGLGASYSVTIDMSNGTAQRQGVSVYDTFFNFENARGSKGSDIIIGDDFNNTLMGYNGDDIINGGAGKDYLYGEAGDDIFVFSDLTHSTDSLQDRIYDFVQGEDLIDLTAFNFTSISDFNINQISSSTYVEDNSSTFSFRIIGLHNLDDNDFIFA